MPSPSSITQFTPRHPPPLQDADDDEEAAASASQEDWMARAAALGRCLPQASFPRLADLLSWQPALLAGVEHRKGKIETGYDADLMVHAAAVLPTALLCCCCCYAHATFACSLCC